MEVEYLNIS